MEDTPNTPQGVPSGAYEPVHTHSTLTPLAPLQTYSSGRTVCGVDAALGKLWSFTSSGVYQVDSLTAVNWSAVTLPTNITPSGAEAAIVTYTPPSGVNAGIKQMFLLGWNSVTTRYEIYSAPPVPKGTAPTWSAVLQQFPANATAIQTAFTATSVGVFAGTYSAAADLTNAIIYKSVDGVTWTAVLTLAAGSGGTRHIHGIFEDPYNLGTLYATVGDGFSPYNPPFYLYKSTDGGNTWAGVSTLTTPTWQAVTLCFTPNYIIACSDQPTAAGPYYLDRATLTPKWYTTKPKCDSIAVPGGVGGRIVTDAAFTASSATITSATAAFTSADVGRVVQGNIQVPLGTYIKSVTNATTAVLSATLANTLTAQTLVIESDTFVPDAYMGAYDPTSGYLYVVAMDFSNAGTVAGIFVITGLDEPWTLLYTINPAGAGSTWFSNYACYLAGGVLWVARFGPVPAFTGAS